MVKVRQVPASDAWLLGLAWLGRRLQQAFKSQTFKSPPLSLGPCSSGG